MSERGPRTRQAQSISGTFSSSDQMLTRIGVIWARAVARPETPPGAMSFGIVKMEREIATSPLPSTVKKISRAKAEGLPKICFIGITCISVISFIIMRTKQSRKP